MKFYVIYSVSSVHKTDKVKHLMLKGVDGFVRTEGNEENPYSYLEDFHKGKHFKQAGVLTKDQFEELLALSGLYADDTRTMGSLTEYGLLPAINFTTDVDPDYPYTYMHKTLSAYVTPLVEGHGEITEHQWERLRKVIIKKYGV